MAGNMMAMDAPSPSGGRDGGSNNYNDLTSSYTIDTNGLFLEITGMTNGESRVEPGQFDRPSLRHHQ